MAIFTATGPQDQHWNIKDVEKDLVRDIEFVSCSCGGISRDGKIFF